MIITNHSLNLSLFNKQTSTVTVDEKQIDRSDLNTERPAIAPSEAPVQTGQDLSKGTLYPTIAETIAEMKSGQSAADNLLNEDSELRFIRLLFEAMSGNKIPLLQAKENLQPSHEKISNFSMELKSIYSKADQVSFELDDTQQLVIERKTHINTETIKSFQASAIVQLKDGSTAEVNLNSNIFETHDLHTQSQMIINGEVVDPLVLTFNSSNAELSQQKIDFDLNVDGEIEAISYATGASAFLALDKNNNGQIDDGGELFGALSGDGFADLARYDENSDDVIDEADAVFSQLRLSSLDTQGELQLSSLADRNVGAIFLNNLATPLNLVDDDNNVTGIVRKSGLFLQDDFTPGVIQHIDIVV